MTATNLIRIGTGAAAEARPPTQPTEAPDLTFAAILEAAQLGGLARPPSPSPQSDRMEDRPLLRFRETSILGRPDPVLQANGQPLLLPNDPSAQRDPRTQVAAPQQAFTQAASVVRNPQFETTHRATEPLLKHPPSRASVRPASVASYRVTHPPPDVPPEHVASTLASAPLRRPPPRQHLSAVHVALHAMEGEPIVYARPGRMAPTERERLRNAIGALLCEYGLSNATVRLDGDDVGASHD